MVAARHFSPLPFGRWVLDRQQNWLGRNKPAQQEPFWSYGGTLLMTYFVLGCRTGARIRQCRPKKMQSVQTLSRVAFLSHMVAKKSGSFQMAGKNIKFVFVQSRNFQLILSIFDAPRGQN